MDIKISFDKFKKRYLFSTVFILLWSSLNVVAQTDITNKFISRWYNSRGITLAYRLFVPDDYGTIQSYPLVVALHGSGGQGTDGRHIYDHRLATAWADPVNQATYPCLVVAPQAPSGTTWNSHIITTVNDLLDSLICEFTIDVNRLYVTGLSMGGYGTWRMITLFPNRFAAAIPICGGGNSTAVSIIAHIPIWNFHGAGDTAVPVESSRKMINAFKKIGRRIIYTHCHGDDCNGLSNDEISNFIACHDDLFYTEYEHGGHQIWDQSYDYPFLFPWVFDKYKMTIDAIHLTNLNNHKLLNGIETINWNAENSEENIEIWYSPDAGINWQSVSNAEPNSGSYQWNTENFDDCSFGLLNIFLKNTNGYIYGKDQSHFFSINNSMNGLPYVKILNGEFEIEEIITQNHFNLTFLIGDSETNPLNVILYYSADNGQSYNQFETYTTVTDTASQIRVVKLADLPNSNNAVIKVEVSDGNKSTFDMTSRFIKSSTRLTGSCIDHISGNSGAIISVNVVDSTHLTKNQYRISFNDTRFNYKVYDVVNINTGKKIVGNASQLDGITEGPCFDGIRLLIKDFNPAEVDFDNSGWIIGTSTLTYEIYLPFIILPSDTLIGFPQSADYKITIFDHIVDTSSAAFGAAEKQMKFTVWNLTEDKKSDIIFIDTNNDQTISRLDQILILEPDSQEVLRLTWAIVFGGETTANQTQPGDEFILKTLKPLSAKDIYEFEGILSTSVSNKDPIPYPQELTLYKNFPNPFNLSTTFSYFLSGSENVNLSIYNLLGQKIISLVNDRQTPGPHSIKWNGKNSQGITVSSGLYFYKIITDNKSITKKMTLLK